MKLTKLTEWLVVIGGLNWGLTLFDFNLVTWLANLVNFPTLSTIVYALVGVSAVYQLAKLLKLAK